MSSALQKTVMVWFDFIESSNGKKIVVWLHFKHETIQPCL